MQIKTFRFIKVHLGPKHMIQSKNKTKNLKINNKD